MKTTYSQPTSRCRLNLIAALACGGVLSASAADMLMVSAQRSGPARQHLVQGTIERVSHEPPFLIVVSVPGEAGPHTFSWFSDTLTERNGREAMISELRPGDPAKLAFEREGSRLRLTAIAAGEKGQPSSQQLLSLAEHRGAFRR